MIKESTERDIIFFQSEKSDETFDWFKRYEDLKPYLDDIIPKKSLKILMLGCGNSSMF